MLNKIIDIYKDKLIKSTQELIAIPSKKAEPKEGMPFGEEINRALVYALKRGEELGFLVGNVDGYAGFIEFGQGSETLGILAHLDVVPEGEGWTYPPFGGEIHDNKIYGRGAIDDKGPAMAALFAMKAVMESDVPVNKKVRLILGTDEESGWEDMDYYFKNQPMPDFGITPDANYPVIHAEKGIVHIELYKKFDSLSSDKSSIVSIKGGSRANMVPDSCTCYLKDQEEPLTTEGVSAHASTPDKGQNAISKMLDLLTSKELGDSDIDKFVADLNRLMGYDTTGEGLGINYSDDVSGSLTLNLGVIDVDRERGSAIIDIRFPVKYTTEEILSAIEERLNNTGIAVRVIHCQHPLYVPKDHFLVKTLSRVYREQTGQDVEPLAIGGGTYARALKTGVAFGAVFPGKAELAHQKDEYIEIDDLILNAKIYAHAIAELVK
ncbi:MAG: Sapep family Mn(2+)-dependent dipeptidase [Caldicoprobacterales bacterium]|jgi:succinyl-diaminopimelate desuccinylase